MKTSPPKWFPSEVKAPRTKLIKWEIDGCLRLIEKGVLQSLSSGRLSKGILWMLKTFIVLFGVLYKRIGHVIKDVSFE